MTVNMMSMTFDQRIGMIIRWRRKLAKMTQEELGQAIDLTSQQIANYELGKSTIPSSTLQKIAAALRCTITDLIPEENGNKFLIAADKTTDGDNTDTQFVQEIVDICKRISSKKKQDAILQYIQFVINS
ncbi:MAG: helix-turn-helix protein [Pseudomonadota bacterium]|jgi:transcriptional regulator with XRE-family HTH domain